MPADGIDGNVPSCTGKGATSKLKEPKKPREPKDQKRLVRIGSRYFSKDTHTERKFNIGLRVEKCPGGIAFKTQNEIY